MLDVLGLVGNVSRSSRQEKNTRHPNDTQAAAGQCLTSLRVDVELSTCGLFPEGNALFAVGQYGAYLLDGSP